MDFETGGARDFCPKKMNSVRPVIEYLYYITIPVRMRLWYVAARICWRIFDIRRRKITNLGKDGARRLLFVAKYPLSLFFVCHQVELMKGDPNLTFYITSPRKTRNMCRREIDRMGVEARYVDLWDALTSDWDLISFPHHCLGALFHPSIPKIFTAHGLENGKKILRDTAYTYSWKAILKDHQSYYTRFLATSPNEFNIAGADKYGRAFTNKIVVTSQALALKLLEENRYREKIRSDFGLKSNTRKAVLIMSTWGEESLLRTIGPAIIDRAVSLNTKYRFFVFAHAHNFRNKKGLKIVNAIKAKGMEVIDPGPSSWIPYAVAADLAISDKTSLSLYFSLLHKPIMFTQIGEEEFVGGSPFMKLYNVSPKLLAPEDLGEQIEKCLRSDYSGRVKVFAEQTFPRIDQKDHLKSAIYECMRSPYPQGFQPS
ncbi:MAG: hypothetical protein SWQ30_02930 [Thermodesulfobacteriota bacterium]|nr:hypothetical protein [Thermodesulfobacteriota bacterium]